MTGKECKKRDDESRKRFDKVVSFVVGNPTYDSSGEKIRYGISNEQLHQYFSNGRKNGVQYKGSYYAEVKYNAFLLLKSLATPPKEICQILCWKSESSCSEYAKKGHDKKVQKVVAKHWKQWIKNKKYPFSIRDNDNNMSFVLTDCVNN